MERMMAEMAAAGAGAGPGGLGGMPPPGADGAEPSAEELMALLSMYEQNPESAPPELSELLKEVRQHKGQTTAADKLAQGQDIVPEPGFVIKTADENGQKVFINICGSSKISPPGDKWNGAVVPENVQNALDQGDQMDEQAQQALRFPISMGEPRVDIDRKGESCTVYDCVLNDDVCQTASKGHRQLKNFIIELAMGWIQHKHKKTLDPQYKLPRMKYKGEQVSSMRIRTDKKALVEEVPDDKPEDVTTPLVTKPIPATAAKPPPEVKKQLREQKQQQQQQGSSSAPSLVETLVEASSSSSGASAAGGGQQLGREVRYVGTPAEAVEVTVRAPQGSPPLDPAHLKVEVLAEAVFVQAKGYQGLQVKLPFAVTAKGGDAALSRDGRELSLRLPYRPFSEVLDEMQAEAPHQLGELGLSSSFLELEP